MAYFCLLGICILVMRSSGFGAWTVRSLFTKHFFVAAVLGDSFDPLRLSAIGPISTSRVLPIYVARVPAAPFTRSYPRHFTLIARTASCSRLKLVDLSGADHFIRERFSPPVVTITRLITTSIMS